MPELEAKHHAKKGQAVIAMDAYSHTQKAPLCLILYGSALLCFVLAWNVGNAPGIFIGDGIGLLFTLLAPAFHHLTVMDLLAKCMCKFLNLFECLLNKLATD